MLDYQIFLFGVLVSLLLAGGLFLTILEFKDIEKNPEKYYPKGFKRKSTADISRSASVAEGAKWEFSLVKQASAPDFRSKY